MSVSLTGASSAHLQSAQTYAQSGGLSSVSALANPVAYLTCQNGQTGQLRLRSDTLVGASPQAWSLIQNIPSWVGGTVFYQNELAYYAGQAWRFVPVGPQQASATPPGGDAAEWLVISPAVSPAAPVLFGNGASRPLIFTLGGGAPASLYLNDAAGGDPSVVVTGVSQDPAVAADHVCRVNGLLDCEGLTFSNSRHPGDTVNGGSQLVAGTGTVTVLTGAADPSCVILLQRTGGASPGVGTLAVTAKTTVGFTVTSLSPSGVALATDVGTFDWLIINPVW